MPTINSAVELRNFHKGLSQQAYTVFGSHSATLEGKKGVIFRTWAPQAAQIWVTGSFNGWNPEEYPMGKRRSPGVWEAFVPGAKELDSYKYRIADAQGNIHMKSDPYARFFEPHPGNASLVYGVESFRWGDKRWMNRRGDKDPRKQPMAIYELFPGSWKGLAAGASPQRGLEYGELGEELAAYLRELGYTHVELAGVAEYWTGGGMGACGAFFAPTSRYGDPEGLMRFVNRMHQAGIGVLLDWNPARFEGVEHGLGEYDGSLCYEAAGAPAGEDRAFDFSKPQVRSFLLSGAMYWLNKFHLDGLRMEVGQVLHPGGAEEEDPNGVELLERIGAAVERHCPGAVLIAGDPPGRPRITRPVKVGGLSLHFRWDTEWAADLLHYISLDPIHRAYNHDKLIAHSHQSLWGSYILSFSDRLPGDCALAVRHPGEENLQMAGLRTLLGYQMSYPGKKLLPMGAEAGSPVRGPEGAFDPSLADRNTELFCYVRELLHFYRKRPTLWEIESSREGFGWLVSDDSTQNIVVFRRMDEQGNELVAVCNFAPVERASYRFGVAGEGDYRVVFSSDWERFGGTGTAPDKKAGKLPGEEIPSHGMERSVCLTIPPLSATWLEPVKAVKRKKAGNKKPGRDKAKKAE